ncbi:MAG: RidA family protein [Syntrophales bacterium]|nr:RidA family protein [Syntrophales bacterium]
MKKNAIICETVPAIGPYSSAVEAGPFIFCSGQIPIDPKTGEVVTGNVAKAAEQALNNLREVLRSAGVDLEDVVKVTLFLVDMDDFPVVNEIYARFFERDYPARTTVQVARLPRNAQIEIEAIAMRQSWK